MNIRKIHLENNNKTKISGRDTNFNNLFVSREFINKLKEQQKIEGAPLTIGNGLEYSAYYINSFIHINRELGKNGGNSIFVPGLLRVKKTGGISCGRNMLLYTFVDKLDVDISNLDYTILFADFNKQKLGDYIDIELPDYTNIYMIILLMDNTKIWKNKQYLSNGYVKFTPTEKYFCIDGSKSSVDINKNHVLAIQGYNDKIGAHTRLDLAFEDWDIDKTDLDYNDVIISLSSVFFDENRINDEIY